MTRRWDILKAENPKMLPEQEEHLAKAREVEIEALRRLGPGGRWAQAVQLNQMVRELKAVGLRSAHPDWTEEQVEAKVRELILYGGC